MTSDDPKHNVPVSEPDSGDDPFEALFAEVCAAPQVSLSEGSDLEGSPLGHGRFVLQRSIGRGSFGEVWRAQDTLLSQQVAIKLLQPVFAFDDVVVSRFQREVLASSRLHHPGIVRILATGREEDVGPFFAMELVEGVPCNQVPNRLLVILEVVEEILAALCAAHARGVVHRDLKPGNILIFADKGRWRCKILDFGVAQLAELTSSLTGQAILGTPAYASPEQVSGAALVGPGSDLYSVGVVLYEMLTGRLPFTGSALQIFMAHKDKPPPPIVARQGLGRVPSALSSLVFELLAKRYRDRPESAMAVRERLHAVIARCPGGDGSTVNIGADDPVTTTRIQLEEVALAVGGRGRVTDAAQQLRALEMQTEILAARQLLSGRTSQQRLLWRLLMRLGRQPKTHVAVISGPTGVGKTALGRWMYQSMQEHGPLRAFDLSLDRDTVAATKKAVLPWLRVPKAVTDGADVRAWLRTQRGVANEILLARLVALIQDRLDPGAVPDLWIAFLHHAQARPTRRPLLLWIDGPDTPGVELMSLVDTLASSGLHMLVVWSADLPVELTGGDVRHRNHVTEIRLANLDLAGTTSLAGQLIPGLERRSIEELHDSTAGHPATARQTLLDWLGSGRLRADGGGIVAAARAVD